MGTNMNELKTLQEEGDKVLENEFSGWWDYKSLLTERIEDFIQAERQKAYTLGMMKGVEMVEGVVKEMDKFGCADLYSQPDDDELILQSKLLALLENLKQELK